MPASDINSSLLFDQIGSENLITISRLHYISLIIILLTQMHELAAFASKLLEISGYPLLAQRMILWAHFSIERPNTAVVRSLIGIAVVKVSLII